MPSRTTLVGRTNQISGGQADGPSAGPAVIQVAGLRKSYGEHVVLDGIDLTVPEGSLCALLGPNGAGKTTLVRILSTLTAVDAGEVRVCGFDVRGDSRAVRSVIGVTGQFSAVDNYLTAEENLVLMAELWHLPRRQGRERAAELRELFGLADTGRKPAYAFSGGTRRRLDLAMTLVGSPRIIFLDEPTTGLDPRGRIGMWELIRDLLRREAVTILLTTQYLEEADELADHIAVLDAGKIIAEGTAQELKQQIPGGHLTLTFASSAALEAAANKLAVVTRNDDDLTLQVISDSSARSVLATLSELDVDQVPQVSLHTPDLNDVFLTLTGQARKEKS